MILVTRLRIRVSDKKTKSLRAHPSFPTGGSAGGLRRSGASDVAISCSFEDRIDIHEVIPTFWGLARS